LLETRTHVVHSDSVTLLTLLLPLWLLSMLSPLLLTSEFACELKSLSEAETGD